MRSLRILSILAFSVPFLIFAVRGADSSGAVVKTASGPVRGEVTGDLMVFKGIPYAAPPVGKLRWRPPQEPASWTDVREAASYGHDCMQLPFPHDAAPLQTEPNEDCLYLNVWAPKEHTGGLLPVMVWIYGGGFVNGGSSPAPYDGSHFAEKGVVFVSFNYRLGRFGFFAFPALLQEGATVGNYAYMDQIAALRWVQKNISAFGGDPRLVTLFGESAGGISVNTLLTSPEAKGLFARAMIESGGGRDNLVPATPLDQPGPNGAPSAVQKGINFAKSMGIDGTDAAALAALRDLPSEKIVNGINMMTSAQQAATYSGPVLDGTIALRSSEEALKQCLQARIPVVVGANSADIGFSFAKTIDEVFVPFGADAEKAKTAFDLQPSDTVAQVGQRVGAVRLMLEPARFVARRVAACGQSAYVFRFSYVATPLRARMSGAGHSSEIPYVFDTLSHSSWGNLGNGLTDQDLRMASEVNSYWVNFAKTGDPNGAGLPEWPKFTANGDEIIDFGLDGPRGGPDPWGTRLDLVEQIQK